MAFLLSMAMQHSWIFLEISKTTIKIVPAIVIATIVIVAVIIATANSVQLGIILYLKASIVMTATAAMFSLSTMIVKFEQVHLSSSASRIVLRK